MWLEKTNTSKFEWIWLVAILFDVFKWLWIWWFWHEQEKFIEISENVAHMVTLGSNPTS